MKIYRLEKDIVKQMGDKLVEYGAAGNPDMAVYQIMYFWALISKVELREVLYEQLPEMMKPMFRLLTDEELEESKLWVVEDERTTNN